MSDGAEKDDRTAPTEANHPVGSIQLSLPVTARAGPDLRKIALRGGLWNGPLPRRGGTESEPASAIPPKRSAQIFCG